MITSTLSTHATQPPRDLIRRFSSAQWERFKPLFPLVEEASAGRPVPTDVTLAWQSYVLKAEAGVDLVLFTLKTPPGAFTSFPLAMYLRVVQHGAIAKAPGPRDALAQYPFEDVAFFDRPIDGRISRAFAAPAGHWDVYIAIGEGAGPDLQVPRTIVVKEEVDLPDLATGLAISSIIVADKIEPDPDAKRPDFEDQLDDPFRLWGMRITPALQAKFSRRRALSTAFVVYNTAPAEGDKPDVEIDYIVFQKRGTMEQRVGQMPAQRFSGRTLPSDFSLSQGNLIVGGQALPLRQLAAGDYRLQITVTDKAGGTSLTRNLTFAVADR